MHTPISDSLFVGTSELAALMRRTDWARTSMGPIDQWPQSVRAIVRMMLTSRYAMWMAWGPDLTFFCNAAYRRDTLGSKYPWALGRPASEVWQEIWPDIGPRIESVLATGEATWDEGAAALPRASGLLRGDLSHVLLQSAARRGTGLVAACSASSARRPTRVIGERRMATLRDLGSDPSVVRTEPPRCSPSRSATRSRQTRTTFRSR